MGIDKSTLLFRGRSLVEHLTSELSAVCSRVSVVGTPEFPDDTPCLGPAGGILTALRRGEEWNLIVAVDMPGLSRHLFADLLEQASKSSADCVIAVDGSGGIHPLCGAYHRRCLPVWEQAVAGGVRKVRDIIARLNASYFQPADDTVVRNVNTPAEWQEFLEHARD